MIVWLGLKLRLVLKHETLLDLGYIRGSLAHFMIKETKAI